MSPSAYIIQGLRSSTKDRKARWKCCKPRVLTFDEFMNIPPCTTGTHSAVDDTPVEPPKPTSDIPILSKPSAETALPAPQPRLPTASPAPSKPATPAPPEDESDDPSIPIPANATCKRRGCNATFSGSSSRDDESCVHHPGQALFHEGSKGWTCCKRRVLEFDEFLKIEGCNTKTRHCFVGKKKEGIEELDTVRTDFYQTPATVIASLYLKKVDREASTIKIRDERTVELDLHTGERKRYKKDLNLFGAIDTEKSSWKVMGTKVEFNLVKADGASWPVLRSDDRHTGEIIQMGRAGRA
ncbi:Hypothetical protein D9617_21g098000 [Elsinoe fawcettii]|nr:Hypothetical protein D9617_21g098000 [Elsinoe fawcettii]